MTFTPTYVSARSCGYRWSGLTRLRRDLNVSDVVGDVSTIPEDILVKIRERRTADPGSTPAQWDAAEQWLARSLSLVRPGAVVSLIMPDGQPFAVKRPRPE